jgi:UDP-galactopyranose mutase
MPVAADAKLSRDITVPQPGLVNLYGSGLGPADNEPVQRDAAAAQTEDKLVSATSSSTTVSVDRTKSGGNGVVRQQRVAACARLRTRVGFDYLIVGAGFAGSVLAERLAAGSAKRVLLIDRRPHIGGNAYDEYDRHGILIHRYGPHIFHTNSSQIVAYLSRFTEWRPYEHRVLAQVDGQLVPIPINLSTINKLYGLSLTPDQVEGWLGDRAEPVPVVRTSEDVVVGRIGRELYEKFFRDYTRKQWGLDPSELDKSVTARVPTRTNTDDRYFSDSFQNMPRYGYTRMFENMLDHPNIKVMLNTDYREIRNEVRYDQLIFTGAIDEFFELRYGKLPYRSLRFRHETLDRMWLQPVAVVNYPSFEVPYTRVTEYKHLTGQQHSKTSVTYEFPAAEGDPYYPVPRSENTELYKQYRALADATPDVYFVGRLATYRYYNMDQVVGQALTLYARLMGRECSGEHRTGLPSEDQQREFWNEAQLIDLSSPGAAA